MILKSHLRNILLALVIFTYQSGYTQEATIKKANCTIDLDGYTDEQIWDQVGAHDATTPYEGYTVPPTLDSAVWKAFWNDTALFVAIEVIEDEWRPYWVSGVPEYWGDRAELFFDVNDTLKDGNGPLTDGKGEGNGHYHINFFLQPDSKGDTIMVAHENIAYSSYHWATAPEVRYTMEYSISFQHLLDAQGNSLSPVSRSTIGFDVSIIDFDEDDAGRKKAVWANNTAPENWDKMDGAGKLHFSTEMLECPTTNKVDIIQENNSQAYPTMVTTDIYFKNTVQSVSIYNTMGQVVKTIKEEISSLNIADLPQGTYIIRITDIKGDNTVTKIQKK